MIFKERVAIFFVGALLMYALVVLAVASSPPEAKEVAKSILTALLSALAGYVYGRRGEKR